MCESPGALRLFTATLVMLHSWKTKLCWQRNVSADAFCQQSTLCCSAGPYGTESGELLTFCTRRGGKSEAFGALVGHVTRRFMCFYVMSINTSLDCINCKLQHQAELVAHVNCIMEYNCFPASYNAVTLRCRRTGKISALKCHAFLSTSNQRDILQVYQDLINLTNDQLAAVKI